MQQSMQRPICVSLSVLYLRPVKSVKHDRRETINKIVRTSRQILSERGREPTPEELAKKLAMPLDRVRKVLKISKEPVSLETPVGDEVESSLGDFIEDQNAQQPLDASI